MYLPYSYIAVTFSLSWKVATLGETRHLRDEGRHAICETKGDPKTAMAPQDRTFRYSLSKQNVN
ncbi:MAG: hypothetical protein AAF757_20330 [Cyanobacteria bacterium P01_D01_bin.116]